MAKEIQSASLRAEARCDGGDAQGDFLWDGRADGVDGQALAALDDPGLGAGAVSHREPLRAVRHDDTRALRNRVPRLGRRTDVARLSVPLQAARSKQAAGDLRAVSAAFRLEFVVRVAEVVAAIAHSGWVGVEFTFWRM